MDSSKKTVVIKNSRSSNRKNHQTDQLEKFNCLVDLSQSIRNQKFTGYIKVNYSQGSIGRVDRFEEILKI